MILKRIALHLTQKCTLNCELCFASIPHYTNPKDLSLPDAEKIIDRYFEIVDRVGIFSATGGEPLMNRNITQIMQKIISYSDRITEH